MTYPTLSQLNSFISQAKWAFVYICLLILSVLVGFGYFIVSTQIGTQLALKGLPYLSDYQINYEHLSGTLSEGNLHLEGIHLQGPNIDLYAKTVDLKMSFFGLLAKKIEIKTLTIDTPSIVKGIEFAPSLDQNISFEEQFKEYINKIDATNPNPFSLKSILSSYKGYDFHIETLNIYHLHFVSGKQHYDINQFAVNHLTSEGKKLFSQLNILMPEINLQINLSDIIKINWDIQIKDLNQYIATAKGNLISKGQWQSDKNHDLLVNIKSNDLMFDTFRATKLDFIFKGNLANHRLNISFNQQEHKFIAELSGQLHQSSHQTIWEGQLSKLFYNHLKYKHIQPSKAKLKLVVGQNNSTLHTDFSLWGKNQFKIEANLAHQKPYVLTGQVIGDIQDLSPVTTLLDLEQSGDFRALKGKGLLKLALEGTVNQPKVKGELLLNKVTSTLPKLNTSITLEQLNFYDLGSPKINIKAIGKMGNGDFQLEGYAKKDSVAPEIKLTLKGSKLLISNTSEYHVLVSPNLSLNIDKHSAMLSGQLLVPKAKITPKDTSEGIGVSEDIVLIKNKKRIVPSSQSVQTLKKLKTNVEVVLGNDIYFEGYGLTTHAQGRMIIETRQDDTSKATGKINLVNGRYGAYGHYFSLSHGQLLFQSDPILDPKIDVRAERIIKPNMRIRNNASGREDIIVGMQLMGRLSKLQTKLYSNPHFNDREIISYLILGHGQNENTGADGQVLMEAVKQITTAFYPKAGRLMEKQTFYDRLKLNWSIGHSPFDDESKDHFSDFERKYVNVGKRLSDKLYIQYSLGLADKISVYSIQYLLGNHLVLEAKTDSQNRTAADLLFTFESG